MRSARVPSRWLLSFLVWHGCLQHLVDAQGTSWTDFCLNKDLFLFVQMPCACKHRNFSSTVLKSSACEAPCDQNVHIIAHCPMQVAAPCRTVSITFRRRAGGIAKGKSLEPVEASVRIHFCNWSNSSCK